MAKALILTTNVILGYDIHDALIEHDPSLDIHLIETGSDLHAALLEDAIVSHAFVDLPFGAAPSEALVAALGARATRTIVLGAEDHAPYADIRGVAFLPMPFARSQLRLLLSSPLQG